MPRLSDFESFRKKVAEVAKDVALKNLEEVIGSGEVEPVEVVYEVLTSTIDDVLSNESIKEELQKLIGLSPSSKVLYVWRNAHTLEHEALHSGLPYVLLLKGIHPEDAIVFRSNIIEYQGYDVGDASMGVLTPYYGGYLMFFKIENGVPVPVPIPGAVGALLGGVIDGVKEAFKKLVQEALDRFNLGEKLEKCKTSNDAEECVLDVATDFIDRLLEIVVPPSPQGWEERMAKMLVKNTADLFKKYMTGELDLESVSRGIADMIVDTALKVHTSDILQNVFASVGSDRYMSKIDIDKVKDAVDTLTHILDYDYDINSRLFNPDKYVVKISYPVGEYAVGLHPPKVDIAITGEDAVYFAELLAKSPLGLIEEKDSYLMAISLLLARGIEHKNRELAQKLRKMLEEGKIDKKILEQVKNLVAQGKRMEALKILSETLEDYIKQLVYT